MTTPIKRIGDSKQTDSLAATTLADLENTMRKTTQEVANIPKEYFAPRAINSRGIINIYYLFLTVLALDSGKTFANLTQNCKVPKVSEDLALLEKIRNSAQDGEVKHLHEALRAGFSKEILHQIFDVPTWSSYFATLPEMIKGVKAISAAIDTITIVEKPVNEVAASIIAGSTPKIDALPTPVKEEKKAALKESPKPTQPAVDLDLENILSQIKQAETKEKSAKARQEEADAALAASLIAGEDESDGADLDIKAQQLRADEEEARRIAAEEEANFAAIDQAAYDTE